jgi:hypothetical protein
MELTQAFLMTSNMKHAATQVSQGAGQGYFFANDYVADSLKLSLNESIQQVSKMLGNLGACDQSTNFMLEQRSLMKAQSKEGRDVRAMLNDNIVDGLEYVRVKEKITQTRQRVSKLLFDSDDSETDSESKSEQKRAFITRCQPDTEKAK